MNTVFNINRFLKIEKRNFFLSKMTYLYIIGGLIGLYLLSMLLKILVGNSLSGLIYTAIFIVAVGGPCFFEKTMSKHGSIFDFILPASSFEKFLSLWLKYIIYIPAGIILLLLLLNLLSGLLPLEGAQVHAQQMSLEYIFKTKVITLIASTQAVFMTGYFYFRKYAFAKTSIILLILFIMLLVIGMIIGYFVFSGQQGDANFNFSSNDNHESSFTMGYATGRTISALTFTQDTVIKVADTIIDILLPVGLWVVCFFKLRETEI